MIEAMIEATCQAINTQQPKQETYMDAYERMLSRAGPHITVHSTPQMPSTSGTFKLKHGGTMGELLPMTTPFFPSRSCLCLDHLGLTRGLYVNCIISDMQCRTRVYTGSAISLIRSGFYLEPVARNHGLGGPTRIVSPWSLVNLPFTWEKILSSCCCKP